MATMVGPPAHKTRSLREANNYHVDAKTAIDLFGGPKWTAAAPQRPSAAAATALKQMVTSRTG
jgi:hypothetical protein